VHIFHISRQYWSTGGLANLFLYEMDVALLCDVWLKCLSKAPLVSLMSNCCVKAKKYVHILPCIGIEAEGDTKDWYFPLAGVGRIQELYAKGIGKQIKPFLLDE